MDTVNYTDLRKNLAGYMDRVADDRAPLLVTRRGGRPAVLMSLDEYASYEETLHLARSPRNAERLDRAIAELRGGGGTERRLAE